jgi:hypothetical protein
VVENRVPLVCDAKRRTSGCERRRNRSVWFVLLAIREVDVRERAIVSGPTRSRRQQLVSADVFCGMHKERSQQLSPQPADRLSTAILLQDIANERLIDAGVWLGGRDSNPNNVAAASGDPAGGRDCCSGRTSRSAALVKAPFGVVPSKGVTTGARRLGAPCELLQFLEPSGRVLVQ